MRISAGLQASLRQLAEQERLPLRRVCLRLVLVRPDRRDSSKRLLQPGLHLRIAESVNQYSTGHNTNDFGLSAMSPNSPILLHFLPKPVSVNTEQG
jgi:hypothetical protein